MSAPAGLGNAKSILSAGSTLGEGPVWYDSRLWFVDIEGASLHRWNPATGRYDTWQFEALIGFAVPAADGRWVLGLHTGPAWWAPGDETPVAISAVVDEPERRRLNDGKCGPDGRLYFGTMRRKPEIGIAALYRMDRDLSVRSLIQGVTVSNGLAWDPARRTMYYIDTQTNRVDAFDWISATGAIANRRPAVEFLDAPGQPDGMCIDREGNLWVALWGGGCVQRVDPRTGELLGRVTVPAELVTSCCFGGPDLKDLYITTARIGLSANELERQPGAGDIFHVRSEVPGLPCDLFRGNV
jgi:sugar lactone lactonase YvrE